VRPQTAVVLEINDRTVTIKPEIESKPEEYIESSMTSMWKIDCSASELPCLASTFVDGNEEAKTKHFDLKAQVFIKTIPEEHKYELTNCLIIRFHGSLLSAKKSKEALESGDNSTCSMICPYKLEYTPNMQKAFLYAFNRAMYLINPSQDLPETPEGKM